MIGKLFYDVLVDEGTERDKNQDDHLVKKLEEEGCEVFVAAVADGVGSFEDSELASSYTIKVISEWIEKTGAKKLNEMRIEDIEKLLKNEVVNVHNQLITLAQKKDLHYGTTLTLMLIIENSYIVVQVGDSRCYLYQDHIIRQITRDQTLAAKKRREGQAVEDKKEESTLLQCIGQGHMNPVIYDGILVHGFNILLCTDGLSNSLSHKYIAETIKLNQSEKRKLELLAKEARSNGESDNITGILIRQLPM